MQIFECIAFKILVLGFFYIHTHTRVCIYIYMGMSVSYKVVQAYLSSLCISIMLVFNDITAYLFHRIAFLINAQDGPLWR